MKIAKLVGREIYDAQGWPALECELTLEDGSYVTASVATGISRSSLEALELRDNAKRMYGKGVQKAAENIETHIAPIIVGQEPNLVSMDLGMIELDGTIDKSKLGANAILASSIAIARAHALVESMEVYELIGYLCEYSSVSLPFAFFNIISGGMHAQSNLRIQEIMIIPIGSQSFRGCLEAAIMLHHHLHGILQQHFSFVGVSSTGALMANFKDDAQALELLMQAIEAVQKISNQKFFIALDVAASHFYDKKTKQYNWLGKKLHSQDLIDLYKRLIGQYPIFSIEDGLSELDAQGWLAMADQLKDKVQLFGDDIFASSPDKIADGIELGIANGAIIKPGQIGTLTQALQAIKLCKEYDLTCVISHRAQETNDTIIVDLAVGTSTGYIKAGGVCRGEHLAKYNELLRIEDALMMSLLDS